MLEVYLRPGALMTWLKCRAFNVAFHRENQGWSGTVSPHYSKNATRGF